MPNEHAVTYQDQLSPADLEYITKKANRLGKSGRDVIRVYEEKDGDGKHIYFSVTGKPNG